MKLDIRQFPKTIVVWVAALLLILGTTGLAMLYYSDMSEDGMSPDEKQVVEKSTSQTDTWHAASTRKSSNNDVSFAPEVKVEVKADARDQLIKAEAGFEKELNADKVIILPSELVKELQEKKGPRLGLFETKMEVEPVDGMLEIRISLKNISGESVSVHYGSGQQYDYWVYNEQNEEVYRWSADKSFTQALIDLELDRGEELTFIEQWDLRDNEGKPLQAGKYEIVSRIMLGLRSGEISSDELTAQLQILQGETQS